MSVKGPPLVKTTTSACVQFLNLGKCASHAMVTCASVPSSALVMKTVLVQKRVPKVLVDSAVLALIQMPLLVSENNARTKSMRVSALILRRLLDRMVSVSVATMIVNTMKKTMMYSHPHPNWSAALRHNSLAISETLVKTVFLPVHRTIAPHVVCVLDSYLILKMMPKNIFAPCTDSTRTLYAITCWAQAQVSS